MWYERKIEDVDEPQANVSLISLPHFHDFYDLHLYQKMESICCILYVQ